MAAQIPTKIRFAMEALILRELQNDGAGTQRIAADAAATALSTIWPHIAEHFAQLLLDRNPDRDADFTAGVNWAADTIRNH